MTLTTLTPGQPSPAPDDFDAFAQGVRETFARHDWKDPLFTVDTISLWDVYLMSFSSDQRQHHTCANCRRFIQAYGGLVTVSEKGNLRSVIWDEQAVPPGFKVTAALMRRQVEALPIEAPFFCSEPKWGNNLTKDRKRGAGFRWSHLFISTVPIWKHPLINADQQIAKVRESFPVLKQSIDEYPVDLVEKALILLKAEEFFRGEKVLGVAEWFLALLQSLPKNERLRDHLIWKAVASAPEGWSNIRSSVFGTLLTDLKTMPYEQVKRRFNEKMHPLKYRRAQVAPTAGAVAQAETVIEKLKSADSLRRRFARIEEVKSIWRPRTIIPTSRGEGVFGGVKVKQQRPSTPSQIIGESKLVTWTKFQRDVLPNAAHISLLAPSLGNYCALVTAANPDAPPVLKWDHEDDRNQFSAYSYNPYSGAANWGLHGGHWVNVVAITNHPMEWVKQKHASHEAGAAVFLLEGARDVNYKKGAGLFVEDLRSEYNPIRKTLEAFIAETPIEGLEDSTANGYYLSQGASNPWNIFVRADVGGVTFTYHLDRWE